MCTLYIMMMNVVCHSWLQTQTYCFARVIHDTCNSTAADINLLKTVLYNAKLSQVISTSCALGQLLQISYLHSNLLQYVSE